VVVITRCLWKWFYLQRKVTVELPRRKDGCYLYTGAFVETANAFVETAVITNRL
jgi:hypothetical protein